MNLSPLDQVSNICREVLNAIKLPKKFNHIKCNHWIEIVFLYIVCRGRINFTWMGRDGGARPLSSVPYFSSLAFSSAFFSIFFPRLS